MRAHIQNTRNGDVEMLWMVGCYGAALMSAHTPTHAMVMLKIIWMVGCYGAALMSAHAMVMLRNDMDGGLLWCCVDERTHTNTRNGDVENDMDGRLLVLVTMELLAVLSCSTFTSGTLLRCAQVHRYNGSCTTSLLRDECTRL